MEGNFYLNHTTDGMYIQCKKKDIIWYVEKKKQSNGGRIMLIGSDMSYKLIIDYISEITADDGLQA